MEVSLLHVLPMASEELLWQISLDEEEIQAGASEALPVYGLRAALFFLNFAFKLTCHDWDLSVE